MSPIAIFLIALASVFGSALLGMILRAYLPEHHLTADSRDVMKMGTGMIATMAALVLGLLISSAKGTFDTMNNGLRQTASKVILLDRTMARYGPEARESRAVLRRTVTNAIKRIWPEEKNEIAFEKAGHVEGDVESLDDKLRQLSPRNDDQRRLLAQALQISGDIQEGRWLLIAQAGQSSIPMPFLVLLICWLTIIFFNFGLFTSRNTSVIIVLFVCAVSAASSLFLILELDQPYAGLIKISSAPLLNALALLGQ
ncbi:MAG TPA: hypothetical protein VFG09_02020 [Thermodesulfovibrionales bacterium]|jgi:hypothetical protein|nr:hypothetical protein [Thermodesulfovibrionales bacterium]